MVVGLAVAGLAAALAGCGRGGPFPTAAAPASPGAADPGYRPPPQVTGAVRGPDGAVSLIGRAMPSAQVRLASPAGALVTTASDGSGAWRAPLGPVLEPTLYGLSAEAEGRKVQAEGYLAVLPGAPGLALLRAGAGAQVQGGDGREARIQAIDLDGGGAVVVSGRAAPGSPVRVMVNGAAAMDGATGVDGRFSLALPKPLAGGAQHIQAATPAGAAAADIQVAPPRIPANGPYRATAEGSGWRIDWRTPAAACRPPC